MVEDIVTMGEGSSLDILSGQSHVDSFLQQGAEGEGLSNGPVTLSLTDHLTASLQDPLHGSVYLEVRSVGRTLREPLPNVSERLLVDSSVGHLQRIFAFEESRPR